MKEQFNFYYSPRQDELDFLFYRNAYIRKFKGIVYTQMCKLGEEKQPPVSDAIFIGTGTMADITINGKTMDGVIITATQTKPQITGTMTYEEIAESFRKTMECNNSLSLTKIEEK